MNKEKNRERYTARRLWYIAVTLSCGAVLALLLQGIFSFAGLSNAQQYVKKSKDSVATKKDPFEELSLMARAVYVFDLKTKRVLYAKNENEKLPLASVTKLMTALVARESFSESAIVTLTKDDLAAEGDTGLYPGERWRLGELLHVMLLVSSNDAAHAVAAFVGAGGQHFEDVMFARERFIQMMNDKALALGLDQMQFSNEAGLDINDEETGLPTRASNFGSARNVADLFAALWTKYPELIEVTARKDARIYSQDNIAHILFNTNEITGRIPGLVASKTGFTDISGGNLAVIFDRGIGDPVVVVVLGSGYKERFDDVQKLVAAVVVSGVMEK